MEIKFNETQCEHLRSFTDQVLTREETMEIRLPEGMPDIGRVLGCWGQSVIRSKQWRGGGMQVSGGVMVWVLYQPENGEEPQSVEGWVPFQEKWEFEDDGRDGFVWVHPVVRTLDARSVSPRKLMVRVNISTQGRALQNCRQILYQPDHTAEDVQFLRRNYPMELPTQCGEKLVQLDEELALPEEFANSQKLLYYSLVPTVTEQKLVGNRLVFRGVCAVRLLCQAAGKVKGWDGTVDFSQFADLDRDCSPAGEGEILPVMTDLELTLSEGRLRLKAAMAAQYILWDRVMVELVEDAYSPRRAVEPVFSQIQLPARLDKHRESVTLEQSVRCDMGELADCSVLWEHPQFRGNSGSIGISCQMLYYDPEGRLQSTSARLEQNLTAQADPDAAVEIRSVSPDRCAVRTDGETVTLTQPVELEYTVRNTGPMQMITGLELGELQEPDPGRPSLILRRCREDLWSLAKASGSTVEAIRSANGLEGEPEPSRMLLIPIA